MKSRVTRSLLACAALAVVFGAGLLVSETPVGAQIRAALVKNVDEPWRTPWRTRSQILPGSGCYGTSDCFNYSGSGGYAVFDLRPVPAGKRWVVVSATGGIGGAYGQASQVQLGYPNGGIVWDGVRWGFAGPFFESPSFGTAVFNAPVDAVFEAGETPFVRVNTTGSFGYTVIVFNGYLIDANN